MWIVCNETVNLGGGKFLPHTKKVQVPEKLGTELIEKGVAAEAVIGKMEDYVAAPGAEEQAGSDEQEEQVDEEQAE